MQKTWLRFLCGANFYRVPESFFWDSVSLLAQIGPDRHDRHPPAK